MKARVKTTGEIMTVERNIGYPGGYVASDGCVYLDDELVLVVEESPDYWTRLEHQYAGMAMQAMIKEYKKAQDKLRFDDKFVHKTCAKESIELARALVEELKKEESK